MISLNVFLLLVNGAWTIMLTFFIGYLLHYLGTHRRHIRTSWREWFSKQPLPIRVAIAILIADIGNWIVRGSIAVWRELGATEPMPYWVVIAIGIGATFGTFGMLCKIRVFSEARFGHVPWLTCAAAVVIFVVVKLS